MSVFLYSQSVLHVNVCLPYVWTVNSVLTEPPKLFTRSEPLKKMAILHRSVYCRPLSWHKRVIPLPGWT